MQQNFVAIERKVSHPFSHLKSQNPNSQNSVNCFFQKIHRILSRSFRFQYYYLSTNLFYVTWITWGKKRENVKYHELAHTVFVLECDLFASFITCTKTNHEVYFNGVFIYNFNTPYDSWDSNGNNMARTSVR